MRRPQLRPRPPAKAPTAPPPVPNRPRPVPTYRALHVLVPPDAFRQAHVAAAASDLRFKEFITILLRTAQPIQPTSER